MLLLAAVPQRLGSHGSRGNHAQMLLPGALLLPHHRVGWVGCLLLHGVDDARGLRTVRMRKCVDRLGVEGQLTVRFIPLLFGSFGQQVVHKRAAGVASAVVIAIL